MTVSRKHGTMTGADVVQMRPVSRAIFVGPELKSQMCDVALYPDLKMHGWPVLTFGLGDFQ